MRKVIVSEWMSLDGVVQSPMYADEDPSGGFTHGGWHKKFMDAQSMKWTVASITGAGGFIFGRRTYEQFAKYWPNAKPEEKEVAKPLNTLPKYVATRTLTLPLEWAHSHALDTGVASAVAALKEEAGDHLLVTGSTELVHTLLAAGLVDELRLMIDPLLLGGGKRIFPDGGALREWELVSSKTTGTGAVLATYSQRA